MKIQALSGAMAAPRLRRAPCAPQDEGERRQCLRQIQGPAQTVVVEVRFREQRVPAGLPVELAGIGDAAADGSAVPADPLGERIDHDVRAVVDGAQQVGVEKVASTMSGRPFRCATLAIPSRSSTSSRGLPMDSMKTARVLGVMAFWKASGSLGSTKWTLMPRAGRMASNWV